MPSRLDFARAAPASAPSSHHMNLRSRFHTSFPFLRLPPEIRNQIYSLLFNFANLAQGPCPSRLHRAQSPGVLRVCKQISDEALQMLYKEPLRLVHQRLHHGDRLTRHVMSADLIRNLRFIHLSYESCNPAQCSRIHRISMFLATAEQIVGLWIEEFLEFARKTGHDEPLPSPRLLKVEVMLEEYDDQRFRVPIRKREAVEAHRQCWKVVNMCTQLSSIAPEPIRVEVGSSLREYHALYEGLQQWSMQLRNNGR